MRVIVMGGTRFVGRAVVVDLVGAGHEVLVVHRGEHEPADLPPAVRHLHTHRRELARHRAELAAFGAQGLIDLAAMTGADAHAVLDSVDPDVGLVVASSMDVYRAYASLSAGATTDPVPLTEDAELRTDPPHDAHVPAPEGWDLDMSEYEKLDVERAYLGRGATVCRLPFVYGEHDYARREEFVLRRVRAHRVRMPIGAGTFLGPRGYAPELARALRLAVEAQHAGTVTATVLNLCEPACASMRLWAEQIVAAAGSSIELVTVPSAALPPDLALTGDMSQHLQADPTRARELLGWVHSPAFPLIERSVAWHLAHPPDTAVADLSADLTDHLTDDFTADDEALARVSDRPQAGQGPA